MQRKRTWLQADVGNFGIITGGATLLINVSQLLYLVYIRNGLCLRIAEKSYLCLTAETTKLCSRFVFLSVRRNISY